MHPSSFKCHCARVLFCYRFLILLISALSLGSLPAVASMTVPHGTDRDNLRQIGFACLIYATDHNETFPKADNVWDYASLLAEKAGLNEARLWQSSEDPATASTYNKSITVLLPAYPGEPRKLNPTFQKVIPSYAVVSGIRQSDPATTPIAWTRGLQPDGRWAKHSPYGGNGGVVVFVGGNVQFFRDRIEIEGRDGKMTSNILDALPRRAAVHVSEYLPTPAEQVQWSAAKRTSHIKMRVPRLEISVFTIPIWLPFIGVSFYRMLTGKKGALRVLIGPALFTVLLVLIIPLLS